jgi:hypothetical protein
VQQCLCFIITLTWAIVIAVQHCAQTMIWLPLLHNNVFQQWYHSPSCAKMASRLGYLPPRKNATGRHGQTCKVSFSHESEECAIFYESDSFSLLSKNESRLIKSPVCLSVCVTH